MNCPQCSKQINESLNFCPFCGAKVKAEIEPTTPSGAIELEKNAVVNSNDNISTAPQSSYYVVEEYYAKRFQQFEQNGGSHVSSWNWYAFFFSPIWFLVKGMWIKGIIFCIVAMLTSGIATPFIGIYGGLRGTYDLYLSKVKNKQMWFM